MNNSLSLVEKNHQGDHIYEQIDNLYTVFIQTASTFTVSNKIGESIVFLTSSVTSLDTMLFMDV